MAALPLMYSGIKKGLEQLLSPRSRKRPLEDPVSPLETREEPPGPPVKRVRLDPGVQEALQDIKSPKGAPDLFSKSQSRTLSRSPPEQRRDVRMMEEPEHVADPRGDYK